MSLRIKFSYFPIWNQVVSKKNKDIGNLKHIKYILPPQLYFHQTYFAPFFILPFPISTVCLCFLLLTLSPFLLPSALKHTTLKHTFFLILSFIFFFLTVLFYYILTKFHGNLYLLQHSKYTWPWYTVTQPKYTKCRKYEWPVPGSAEWGWWEVTVLARNFVS